MREQSPGDEAAVQTLFRAVYPDDPDLWDRVSTPEKSPSHVTTWLAFDGDTVVGQANVYRFPRAPRSANLGYHVHPEYRGRGIARALSEAAIEATRKTDVARLMIRTYAGNGPACALARRLGFAEIEGPGGDPAVRRLGLAL